jgi:transcription elongation factor Elf1
MDKKLICPHCGETITKILVTQYPVAHVDIYTSVDGNYWSWKDDAEEIFDKDTVGYAMSCGHCGRDLPPDMHDKFTEAYGSDNWKYIGG